MKPINFSVIFSIVLIFGGINAQEDIDERFKEFLIGAMANYSTWLFERGLDPTEPDSFADSSFWAEEEKFYFEAKTFDKWYEGISKNIQVISVESNLADGNFTLSYSYGSTGDIHGGNYSLLGGVVNGPRIEAEGEFVESGRTVTPREDMIFDDFIVENGYLKIISVGVWHFQSKFENIEVTQLSAGGYENEVKQILLERMDRYTASINLLRNMMQYLPVILMQTPIEQIIGGPIPPKSQPSTEKRKSPYRNADSLISITRTGEVQVFKNAFNKI